MIDQPLWAAETAILIDRGAGSAPADVNPTIVVDKRPIVVVDSATPVVAGTVVVESAAIVPVVPVTTTASTVMVEEAPTSVHQHVTATPNMVTTTTVERTPVTTTVVEPDGDVYQKTTVQTTKQTVITPNTSGVKKSTSRYVYDSVYRGKAHYHWNGKRWVYHRS